MWILPPWIRQSLVDMLGLPPASPPPKKKTHTARTLVNTLWRAARKTSFSLAPKVFVQDQSLSDLSEHNRLKDCSELDKKSICHNVGISLTHTTDYHSIRLDICHGK